MKIILGFLRPGFDIKRIFLDECERRIFADSHNVRNGFGNFVVIGIGLIIIYTEVICARGFGRSGKGKGKSVVVVSAGIGSARGKSVRNFTGNGIGSGIVYNVNNKAKLLADISAFN